RHHRLLDPPGHDPRPVQAADRLSGHAALEAAPDLGLREGLGALRRVNADLPPPVPERARADVPPHRRLVAVLPAAVVLREALAAGSELGPPPGRPARRRRVRDARAP